MSYLLRRPKRNLIRLGSFVFAWARKRPIVTSAGIPLPDPPKTSRRKVVLKSVNTSLMRSLGSPTFTRATPLGKTNVVIDGRETGEVLDDIRKKLCR